ncbi:MAG: hypothetical protein DRO12_00010 [Thermoprotei archaeon]|nr:MAG: hypothetical protein DRO12_00010 [Thermoprotei archaeon]
MGSLETNYVRYILKSVKSQVIGCIDEGLICLDPPAATTAILRKKLGLSESTIRSFWRFAKNHKFSVEDALIYKFAEARVGLEMNVTQGTAYAIEDVYVDSIDCKLHPRRCSEVPNANMLYVYVVASAEGSMVKVNTVYLLKKLIQVEGPRILQVINNLVLTLVNDEKTRASVEDLLYLVSIVRKYRKYTQDIFVKVPENLDELKKFSPLVRKFFRVLRRD